MIEPILDYQTNQRNCVIRWKLYNPKSYIENKVVLDIGCSQGWFVEKSIEYGASKVIGVDIADYKWNNINNKIEYHVDNGNHYIKNIKNRVDTILLQSVDVDIDIIKNIRDCGTETIFFEPYLDSENKVSGKKMNGYNDLENLDMIFIKLELVIGIEICT